MIRDRGNQIFALRHGISIANEQGLIISDPVTGCHAYGLAESGRSELTAKLNKYADRLGRDVVLVSSDFLRTRETANLVAEKLGVVVRLSARLRERFFGILEGQANANYQRVWERDCVSEDASDWQVESLSNVAERMFAEVSDTNNTFENHSIVLVSHGDPLQILETAMLNLPLSTHRDRTPLQPGELRRLAFS